MYIFEEYLLSLSYFYLNLAYKYWFLAIQLNVGERAGFAPPPLSHQEVIMQYKLFLFITTFINDAQ